MDEIKAARIDEIAVSWWGRGSAEDARLGAVVAAAHRDGISVAAHLEPYAGRTVESTVADVAYLRGLRHHDVLRLPSVRPSGRRLGGREREPCTPAGHDLFAQTGARRRGSRGADFDGVYTYDIVTYSGDKFGRLCRQAHHMHLLCAPSVGPGYDARRGGRRHEAEAAPSRPRPTTDVARRDRGGGRPRDDHVVQRVARGHADRAGCAGRPARAYRYLGYDGAYGVCTARRGERVPRAHALLVGRLPQHVARAAEDQGRRRRPSAATPRSCSCSRSTTASGQLVEAERSRRRSSEPNASSSSTEITPRLPVCRRRDRLELAKLLERVDAHVRVGADAQADLAVARRARPAGSRRRGSPRSSGRRRCARPRRRAGRARPVGVRGVHDRRARAEAAFARRAARSAARRARPGTRRSPAAARRRGRAAAARARRRRRPSSRSASAGQARTEWGATPTRDPVRAQLLELAQVLGHRGLAEARAAAAQVAGVEADEVRFPPRPPRPPPPAPPRARGSGTRRPPCSRSRGARGTPRRSSRRISSTVSDSASAIIVSRQAQKSPPPARPRRAR